MLEKPFKIVLTNLSFFIDAKWQKKCGGKKSFKIQLNHIGIK